MGLDFQPIDTFDDQARADLAKVGPLSMYEGAQSAGFAALFAILQNGDRVGSVLAKSETTPDGKTELLLEAAYAETVSTILYDGLSYFEHLARANGFDAINFQTERPGLALYAMKKKGASALLRWEL